MKYSLINPPSPIHLDIDFRELPKPLLKEYFSWHMNAMEERLKILERAIQTSKGYEDWTSTYEVESLKRLGKWFVEQIYITPKSRELVEYERDMLHEMRIEPVHWEFTEETISLCFDVGLYLSNTLTTQLPDLKWIQPLRSINTPNYGEPVISNGKLNMDSWNIMHVIALKLIKPPYDTDIIYDIYHIWHHLLKYNTMPK